MAPCDASGDHCPADVQAVVEELQSALACGTSCPEAPDHVSVICRHPEFGVYVQAAIGKSDIGVEGPKGIVGALGDPVSERSRPNSESTPSTLERRNASTV